MASEGRARAIQGSLQYNDGTVNAARYYVGFDESGPPNRERIDSSRYATWVEADGVIGIRRGTSVMVGASKSYTAKYDTIDWGN